MSNFLPYPLAMSKTGKINAVEFWNRVDYLRRVNDLTVADLQVAIGKTGTYLYVARSNNAMPSTDIIIKIADALHCSTDYLLDHIMLEKGEDPELQAFIQRWNTDPQFKALIKQLMAQLGN